MFKKMICSKCGFIYFISNENLIEIDDKMYSQCGLCGKLNLYKNYQKQILNAKYGKYGNANNYKHGRFEILHIK